MKYTAFVPARSGSKRLPNKNIIELAGKPLVVWTLEACLGASQVDEVILSTDSMEYYELARERLGADKLSLDFRNPEEAGDKVKIFDYLKDRREKIFAGRDGAFILALPTAPLRNSKHVDEAISLFEQSGKPVFSASPYDFAISFAFQVDGGGWSTLSESNPMLTGNTRSQDQQEAYHPNGAIYVRAIDDLANEHLQTLYSEAVPYLMSRQDSVDIDNEIDFKIAEVLIRDRRLTT